MDTEISPPLLNHDIDPDLARMGKAQICPDTAAEFLQSWPLTPVQAESFRLYGEILAATQKKLNLISNATLDKMWSRHFHDSAQLLPILAGLERTSQPATDATQPWLLDLGSGAGFPGLVLAMLSGKSVHLVEANPHKAQFLRDVVTATHLTNVTLHGCKIMAMPPLSPAYVTARALAPLNQLLPLAAHIKSRMPKSKPPELLTEPPVFIFPKGKTWQTEINIARNEWKFTYNTVKSCTDPESEIIIIKEFHRVHRQKNAHHRHR
ncbi:MAG: 16S rRNA (guanine(527)-N(7))-methyltransferase RsmG [Candidatus Symbiobacter sp.]|nr:16S rRNA (guanine(527)-N(7))-methyltransferase RsmG [Candidatus Symbiobacter sp.]